MSSHLLICRHVFICCILRALLWRVLSAISQASLPSSAVEESGTPSWKSNGKRQSSQLPWNVLGGWRSILGLQMVSYGLGTLIELEDSGILCIYNNVRIRISSIWWILVNWWLQLRCLMPRRRIARSRRNFGGAAHPRPLLLQGQLHHPRNHSRCRCRTRPCRTRPCRCQCHNLCCPGSWRRRQWMSLDSLEYCRNFMQVPFERENARHDFDTFVCRFFDPW